jgi:site-specific recombinase XerD
MRSAWTGFQSALAELIERFLAHKRALGRRFDVEEKTLRLFDRYLAQRMVAAPSHVTPRLVEDFLASRPRQRPRSYNHLLGTVRRLFDWLVDQGILDRSPVEARPRRQTSTRIPFIFDLPEARRLLEAARNLKDNPRAPMRGRTYHAIFAILYGLGLRVGEVCRLSVGDVDLQRRLLVIRETKFYKSRLVPFGPRMEALLLDYLQARRHRRGNLSSQEPLFSFTRRGEINPCTISLAFHQMVPRLGLNVPPGCSPPRLHDLRHSFAVGTLLRWYRTGVDPGAGLLTLATFLGHVDVTSTAVYLTVTGALLQEANRRFEAFAQPVVRGGLPS